MKKLVLFVFVLLAVSVSAQNEDETSKKLQNEYMQFLKVEGFMPSVDEDGDVSFKKEGNTYYLRPTNDNLYFKLSRWLSNEEKIQDVKIHKAMNATVAEYKAVRVYATASYSGIWVEVACYLSEEDDFKTIFYRALSVVEDAVPFFKEEFNK